MDNSDVITKVPLAIIAQHWQDNEVDEKRLARRLIEKIAHRTTARNPHYEGGVSLIVTLKTPQGHHIGTLHEIVMPDGSVPHRHPKDYTLRDCSRVRINNEPF